MLKRDITYEDFDGNTQTETFYFNISKPELIELEVDVDKGFSAWMETIIKAEDYKTLIAQFKRIVLMAYGERSEDGKRFIKSEQLREEFSQTAAYIALFTELATDDNAAATFMLGVMPSDMTGQVEDVMKAKDLKADVAKAMTAGETTPNPPSA
jgi:hypothetical protein